MQSLSLTVPAPEPAIGRLSWRLVAGALRGDALAAFPDEAFDEEVVIQNFLGRRHILLQRPEAIRRVLVENPANYARTPAVLRVLRPMFGRGLFLSTGEEWRRQRHAVAPGFAPRMVSVLAPPVVAAARAFAAELARAGEQAADLAPQLQRFALEAIGGAVFSLDMAHYAPRLRELIFAYATRLGRPSLADFLLPLAIRTPRDIARARFRRRWRRLIRDIVESRARRADCAARQDLFDVLAAPDPETGAAPDLESLGDQVATIVVAGHETTASALFWALYLLARHRAVQERLAAEAARFAPTAKNAAEILPELRYTRAVVDEVLRLYPPAFVIVRRALGDDVAGSVPVRKGTQVLIAPWVLHRHRRLWAAPQRFDPERFLPGMPPPPRFAYLPFGAGPRVCVGAPFALTELVLVIATLVSAFRVDLATGCPVKPVGLVTTRPEIPPRFILHPRSAA